MGQHLTALILGLKLLGDAIAGAVPGRPTACDSSRN